MTKFSKHIGLDVHKETIAVGIADGRGGHTISAGWKAVAIYPRNGIIGPP